MGLVTTSVYSCESSSPPLLLKRSRFLKADVFSRMRHNISENTHFWAHQVNISLSLWLSYCISLSLWFISYCIFYQLLYFGRSATFSGNSQHQICPKLEEEILSPTLIQGHSQLSYAHLWSRQRSGKVTLIAIKK